MPEADTIIGIGFLVIISVGFFEISNYFYKHIIKRIKKLSLAVKDVTDGNYDKFIDFEESNELGNLKNSINEMTQILQRTMKELVRSNSELENYIYLISHDLKTPAVSIEGFISLLRKKFPELLEENQIAHYFDRIENNAQKMQQLILDVLELSRTSVKNP